MAALLDDVVEQEKLAAAGALEGRAGRYSFPACPTDSLFCLVLRSFEVLCGTSDLVVLETLRKVV